MAAYFLDWGELALRWAHIVTAMAWIGASFYFMWLDASLEPASKSRPREEGDLWMVHSGGFYHIVKLQLAPGEIPPTLHWFKWEAAFTWFTGAGLIATLYYASAGSMMVDPAVADIGPAAAVAISVAILVVGWLVYDVLWESALARRGPWGLALSFALFIGLAFLATSLFGGRAAFLQVGATLGTIMAANVWVRIIPAQRDLVAATREGRPPSPAHAANAKRRSTHNSYLTLPVIFMMISNHYPFTFAPAWNWLLLLVVAAVGAGVRHWFILRNRKKSNIWLWPAAVTAMIVLAVATLPRDFGAGGARVAFARTVQPIIAARCLACHGVPAEDAPAGLSFNDPKVVQRNADRILAQAVNSRAMPQGNITGMTEEEREILGRWIAQGAPIE